MMLSANGTNRISFRRLFPWRFLEKEKNKFKENFQTISKVSFGNVLKALKISSGNSFRIPRIQMDKGSSNSLLVRPLYLQEMSVKVSISECINKQGT